ncbi:FecR family protein [Pedobacter sp. SYSU D00535]|uniref:FecR family protein n=1 Tax=Pedobacter sp. SYSU D00535 TaxID=2810308 RepID=UPI001A962F42|nr:FecR family protein [Pedobacter sp. SYSU D00535]
MASEKDILSRIIQAESLAKEEELWLLEYLERGEVSELKCLLKDEFDGSLSNANTFAKPSSATILGNIHKQINSRQHSRNLWKRMGRLAVAASLLLGVSIAVYLTRRGSESGLKHLNTTKVLSRDIAPGGRKATLTLADGRVIVLTDASEGALLSKGGVEIKKKENGLIEYCVKESSCRSASLNLQFNTIATPVGGQYKVILSDGTLVWLNALSSIRFPATFSPSERRVEITGEVYFEVAKDRKRPFKVFTGTQTVEVLGTHFNINAYPEVEGIQTTLFEGSVRVSKGAKSVKLKPGEQARVARVLTVRKLEDAASTVSWLSGTFYFKDAGIKNVMREAARWYDLEVEYQGEPSQKQLNGKISKNVPLSQFLSMLEFSGIKYRQEGRKLVIQ